MASDSENCHKCCLLYTSVQPPSKTTKEIIKSNLLTYFNLIFLLIAILLVVVGSFRDLTFLPIIIANTLIGIIQELNAKKTLEKLTVLNAPKVRAVRNGKTKMVSSEDLVSVSYTHLDVYKRQYLNTSILPGWTAVWIRSASMNPVSAPAPPWLKPILWKQIW